MKIEIIEREIGSTLVIEHTSSMLKMPGLMKHGFVSILEYLKTKNINEPEDAPFARYNEIDWDKEVNANQLINFIRIFTKKWHFFVGFPINKELDSSKNIKYENISKAKYISCIHYGSYQAVGKTYKKMVNFAVKNGVSLASQSYEFYLNDPTEVGKAKLETLCLIPVKEV